MDMDDLKGKYIVADFEATPDSYGNLISSLIPYTTQIKSIQQAREAMRNLLKESAKKGERRTCAIVQIKEIDNNWSIDKEINKIEREIKALENAREELLKRKDEEKEIKTTHPTD